MKKFASLSEAFDWWCKSVYPSLPPDVKKGKYTSAWKDFTYKQGISDKRMTEVLSKFGDVNVQTVVTFKPK
ncbi:hypothetical protein [Dyadobacter luticola]|uniref:Uncharacterized protein n=1 Tax=Dyadobacter luticola TaxID=1979387 RepID=A0A5R9KP99_9BACT|nr:hypothetical protein [Dyadobacter luticola]TLU98020.1 hypothetical protein FEN17_24850 [Dyadobacter luticola]